MRCHEPEEREDEEEMGGEKATDQREMDKKIDSKREASTNFHFSSHFTVFHGSQSTPPLEEDALENLPM